VVFLVITAHELAHGLTCKHFGGEVHELGFLLIYLQPALYCNVSDAWLFPEKSKRLWVGFAGPYFELFLWALATLAWRLTDVETGLNYVAFIVMTSSGVKTLLNFNPLIKLDGYYLLSDWLEVPNLRKKGFACFSDGIKRLFGTPVPRLEQMPRRERRICLAYGLVAGIGSIWLLGYAVAKIGSYLLQQSQPMAFALSAWFLGIKFRSRFRRFFGKSSNASVDPDDPDDANLQDTAEAPKPFQPEEELVREPANQPVPRAGSRLPDSAESPGPFERGERLVYMPDGTSVRVFKSQQASKPQETSAARSANTPDAPEPVRAAESPKATTAIKRKGVPRTVKRVLGPVVFGGATSSALFYLHPELRTKGPFYVPPVHNA